MASSNNVPLSILSSSGGSGEMAIGDNRVEPPSKYGYWIVVLNRETLKIEYNKMHDDYTSAPDLGNYNNSEHILLFSVMYQNINHYPQGDFFNFLDANGAGAELRRIDQIGSQFSCGSWGAFGYSLASTLGNTNAPGFESSAIASGGGSAVLTLQLLPVDVGGKTTYSIINLSNA